MIMITITFILNVIDYEYDYINYNHDYNVYNTNMNVILHQYLLSDMYNTDINMPVFTCFFVRTRRTF